MRINDRTTFTTRTTLGNFPVGGVIGTAPNTVDIANSFQITQTTAGQILSLPVPSVPDDGVLVDIINNGTASFTMHTAVIAVNTHTFFILNNGVWIPQNVGVSPVDFFRSNNGVLLPNGVTDTTEDIGRTGKVGIGLVSPISTLHISGANANGGGAAANLARFSDSTSGAYVYIDNSNVPATNNIRMGALFTGGTNWELQAGTNGNQITLSKAAGGPVGFSVTTPLNTIHVGPAIIANTGGIRLPITSASPLQVGQALGVNVAGDVVVIPSTATLTLNAQVGTTYTTTALDSNNVITLNNASPITVKLSNLTSPSITTFVQKGLGVVTFVSGTLTRRHVANLFTMAGQNAVVSVTVDNSDATLSGDLS